jgi:hypothetical protein
MMNLLTRSDGASCDDGNVPNPVDIHPNPAIIMVV